MRKRLWRAALVGGLTLSAMGLASSAPVQADSYGGGTLVGVAHGSYSPGEDTTPTRQDVTIAGTFSGMMVVTNTGQPVPEETLGPVACTLHGSTEAVGGVEATILQDAGTVTGWCDPGTTPGVGTFHTFDCTLKWNRVLTEMEVTMSCKWYIIGPLGEGQVKAFGAGHFKWVPDVSTSLKVTGFTMLGVTLHVGELPIL